MEQYRELHLEVVGWLVVVLLLLATLLVRWWASSNQRQDGFTKLFSARYSLGFAVLIAVLPLVAFKILPDILYGIFVLDPEKPLLAAPALQVNWFWEWLQYALRFANLTWISFLAALMVTGTYRVTILNALERLNRGAAPPPNQLNFTPLPQTAPNPARSFPWTGFLLLGLWIPLSAAVITILDCTNAKAEEFIEFTLTATIGAIATGIILGLVTTALTLLLLLVLQWLVIPDFIDCRVGLLPFEDRFQSLGRKPWPLTKLFWGLFAKFVNSPGYTEQRGAGQIAFRPGHAQLFVVVLISLAAYFIFYIVGLSVPPVRHSLLFPTLWYLLVIVIIAGYLGTALAFAVDVFRVPPLLVFVLVIVVLHYVSVNSDHYFVVKGVEPENEAAMRTITLKEALADWDFPKSTSKGDPKLTADDKMQLRRGTLVIVAASGGGIQASAWTARVLTGLDEIFEDFSQSVALISSVSGGSVGAYYYVGERGPRINGQTAQIGIDQRRLIENLAYSSSLEATAWGTAFPDLMRFVFPPAVFVHLTDRGAVIEEDWRRKVGQDKLDNETLRMWTSPVLSGQMPIVAFNATLAQTGEHLVMSPVVAKGRQIPLDSDPCKTENQPMRYMQFLQDYSGTHQADLLAATAARLSATFSYVSPICMGFADQQFKTNLDDPAIPNGEKDRLESQLKRRVADGGYFDNEGIVVATKWIEELIANFQESEHFQNVLIVRIMPFPEPESDTDSSEKSDHTSFLWETLGPLFCLTAARTGAQVERGDWETTLLTMEKASRIDQVRKQQATEVLCLLKQVSPQHEQDVKDLVKIVNPPTEPGKNAAAKNVQEDKARINATLGTLFGDIQANADSRKEFQSKTGQSPEAEKDKLIATVLKALDPMPNSEPKRIWHVTIRPKSSGKNGDPLSWKLTPTQKALIESNWQGIHADIIDKQPAPPRDEVRRLTPAQLRYFFTKVTPAAAPAR